MPKSKTQAQKQAEREQRLQEQKAIRDEEKRIRDAEFKKQLPTTIQQDPIPTGKSKKQQRELKKLQQQQVSVSTETVATETVANERELSVIEDLPIDFNDGDPSDNDTEKANYIAEETTAVAAAAPVIPAAADSFPKVMRATLEAAKQQAKIEAVADQPARLVQNHSTHCEGLKTVLIRLEKHLIGCTIIPGKLSQVQAKCDEFTLEFQRAQNKNTYKLVARNGHTAQDVLISVSDPEIYTEEVIKEKIALALENNAASQHKPSTQDDICISSFNREMKYARDSLWRESHQQKHTHQKEREAQAKKEQQLKAQERKLATKGLPAEKVTDYAQRDLEIISGTARTKHSMK